MVHFTLLTLFFNFDGKEDGWLYSYTRWFPACYCGIWESFFDKLWEGEAGSWEVRRWAETHQQWHSLVMIIMCDVSGGLWPLWLMLVEDEGMRHRRISCIREQRNQTMSWKAISSGTRVMIIILDAGWGGWYMNRWILENTDDMMVMKIYLTWLKVVVEK